MTKYTVKVNGEVFEVEVERTYGAASATPAAKPAAAPAAAPAAKPAAPAAAPAAAGSGSPVTAPMPGNVWEVKVAVGDAVSAGDVVMVLEAMKMEIEVTSTVSGTVQSIVAPKGTAVNTGDTLLTVA